MLDQTEIWGIRRLSQRLELFVIFFKPCLIIQTFKSHGRMCSGYKKAKGMIQSLCYYPISKMLCLERARWCCG